MSVVTTFECETQRTESPRVSQFFGKRVHFIGIGGCGMSGLARMLLDAGAIVTGSDPKPNATTFAFMKSGIRISRAQDGELLAPDVDLVVRTAAVKDDNAEFKRALSLRLPHMKYAQLLGEVMRERQGVAVAGTHGKSTTTAMIAYALTQCHQDPSWVVGGTVPQLGGGSASGQGTRFVVEACEFARSFHSLPPTIALITNIEADHLDYYKDIDDIIESFTHFVSLLPPSGMVICNATDANVKRALADTHCTIQTVGVDVDATWSTRCTGIINGCHTGQVFYKNQPVATLKLAVPGAHNLFNATMAIAACVACGVPAEEAAQALATFAGVDRRMSHVGTYNGADIIDDYGHHPTEIRATLKALRERFLPRKLYCVFQPHQHSRTRLLLEEFAHCFADADQVVLSDIYQCRDSEADQQAMNSAILASHIAATGKNVLYIPAFAQITEHLKAVVAPGDLVLTIGAGNVCDIGKDLADEPAT